MGAFSLHLGAIYTISCTVFYNSFSLSPPHSSNSYRTKNSSPSLSSLPSCPPPPSLHEILAISWHSLWALGFILFYFLKKSLMLKKEGNILVKEDAEFQGPFQFQSSFYFLQSSIHPEMHDQVLTMFWVYIVYPVSCRKAPHCKPAGMSG